ncbi:hypothetical protein BCAR13_280017 [Paraburkholderia caribensis]|jgi:hypothetical protein|nr:hypothetical protein BCAR13_280017 [Paraburkholderia caribensis]
MAFVATTDSVSDYSAFGIQQYGRASLGTRLGRILIAVQSDHVRDGNVITPAWWIFTRHTNGAINRRKRATNEVIAPMSKYSTLAGA